jgi:acyl-CoA thioester hydrolase
MPFTYQTRVRYGECDQQGVVFNPNYMVYMDDATEVWISSVAPEGGYQALGWEYMLVRSTLEWQGSARCGDILSIDVGIVRYGASSFDVGYVGKVDERPVFSARAVCVSVEPETYRKCTTPDWIRGLLGEAVDWDVPA